MRLNGNAGTSPFCLFAVYVKSLILLAQGACPRLNVAIFLPPLFLNGRRQPEEPESLTKN